MIKHAFFWGVLFLGLCLASPAVWAEDSAVGDAGSVPNEIRAFAIENLWPDGAPIGDGQTEEVAVPLHAQIPADAKNVPAVVICPGGGYSMRCDQPEGYQIADWLNKNGIAGFVLDYRLPAHRKTVPLSDAQRAIRYVRAHAAEYGVDPNRIGIVGFSAGGHLAASATVHFDAGNPNAADPVDRVSCRPDFSLLVYPVISMTDELTHAGSRANLLGGKPTAEEIDDYSCEKQVSADTPPTLLAHAWDDTVVVPENSASFARRMKELGRPVVYLELSGGGHGLNHYQGESWDKWQAEAIRFISELPKK